MLLMRWGGNDGGQIWKKLQKQVVFDKTTCFCWSEMGDSNSRHLAPKASALPTALIPDLGFEFCARCGQTCGQADFLTTAAYGEIACIAGVSRDCGHGIFRLEGRATRTQSRRATNCATPQYSIKPHYIIAFWGGFVKRFSLWSKLWIGFKNVQILEKQKHADPCAAGICAAKPYYYTAWAARLQGLFAVRGALFCVLGAHTLHGLMLL